MYKNTIRSKILSKYTITGTEKQQKPRRFWVENISNHPCVTIRKLRTGALRVCLTWQKAKDQGLFDNTETKAE